MQSLLVSASQHCSQKRRLRREVVPHTRMGHPDTLRYVAKRSIPKSGLGEDLERAVEDLVAPTGALCVLSARSAHASRVTHPPTVLDARETQYVARPPEMS